MDGHRASGAACGLSWTRHPAVETSAFPADRAAATTRGCRLPGHATFRPTRSREAISPSRADCCSAGAIRQPGGLDEAAAARSLRHARLCPRGWLL